MNLRSSGIRTNRVGTRQSRSQNFIAELANRKGFLLAGAFGLIALLTPGTVSADTITTYNITFTATSGSPAPASGSFTYDSTNPRFTNFLVSWDGATYDLSTAANNGPFTGGTGCAGESQTPAYAFSIMSKALTGCLSPGYFWDAKASAAGGFFEFAADSETIPALTLAFDSVTATESNGSSTASADGSWSITAVPVGTPEPGTIALLLTGLIGIAGLVRRLGSEPISNC